MLIESNVMQLWWKIEFDRRGVWGTLGGIVLKRMR